MASAGMLVTYPFQAGELAGAVDELVVDFLGGALELEEPGVAHRGGARSDLLGAFDHRVDRAIVTLVPLERVLVYDPPGAGVLAGAHDTGRFEDLPVGEVV